MVIIFSQRFPSYHPLKGQPTFFVEKTLKSIDKNREMNIWNRSDLSFINENALNECKPKHHTIRGGSRWKVGDKFSPRIWSGKPYQSKQIVIAPDIEIKQVYDIEIKSAYKQLPLDYDTDIIINHRYYHADDEIMKRLAQNDGLSLAELLQWFKYPKAFKGQIIIWDEETKY